MLTRNIIEKIPRFRPIPLNSEERKVILGSSEECEICAKTLACWEKRLCLICGRITCPSCHTKNEYGACYSCCETIDDLIDTDSLLSEGGLKNEQRFG